MDRQQELEEFVASAELLELCDVGFFRFAIEINVLVEMLEDEGGIGGLVAVSAREGTALVYGAHASLDNISVGADEQAQFIHSVVTVEHFLEQAGTQEKRELAGVDLVVLGSFAEEAISDRVADDDPIDAVAEFEIQPLRGGGFLKGQRDGALESLEILFELTEIGRTLKDLGDFHRAREMADSHSQLRPVQGDTVIEVSKRRALFLRSMLAFRRTRYYIGHGHKGLLSLVRSQTEFVYL